MNPVTDSRFLILSLLCLLSSFHTATAKGGILNQKFPDFLNNSYAASGRHLFEERRISVQEHFRRLEKLAEGYMTNADLEKAITAFNERCSSISRVYSIGESVLGVPLWVIEISDKPGKDEPEPAFKFIGNVHGDEPVGRELLLLLANWLCDNYMKHPLATLIVDNVHLHILPSLNPDGFGMRKRGNANNVDLNRDFPDQFFHMNDDLDLRQPETKAIMNWLGKTHFTASATLHGGALVANFPWDGSTDEKTHYQECPDDKTFRFMASLYSTSHHNMSLSQEFPGGITNGAKWYPIYGGMQDWNYIYNGCFELTLEISDDKWPHVNEIPVLWEYNKKSMLNLIASLVKTGVHGRVFSSDYGRPLPALITIKGINYTLKAGEAFADYHRLLAPGDKYEVTATALGYKPKSTSITLGEEATSVDFILDPLLPSSIDGSYDYIFDSRKLKIVEFVPGQESYILLIFIFILIFLCFVLKRRSIVSYVRHKWGVGHKLPSVTV